jgi:hypothetical protein
LPEIIRACKTFSSRRINQYRATPGVSLWQRNYYEHVIRNEGPLNQIRQYIANNPASWAADLRPLRSQVALSQNRNKKTRNRIVALRHPDENSNGSVCRFGHRSPKMTIAWNTSDETVVNRKAFTRIELPAIAALVEEKKRYRDDFLSLLTIFADRSLR